MKFVSLRTERAHRRGKLDKPPGAIRESFTKPMTAPEQIHTYTELRQQIHDDSGSNIPNGSSQMASAPRVILTSRASWNCSTFRRAADPTSLSLLFIPSRTGIKLNRDCGGVVAPAQRQI
jgi:hypothetical protein